MTETLLFSPMTIRGVTLKNRIVVPPMHQYSAAKGFPTDWHLMNAGKFAAGGAGLVVVESTKVERRGCSTVGDLGIKDDGFVEPLSVSSHSSSSRIRLRAVAVIDESKRRFNHPSSDTDSHTGSVGHCSTVPVGRGSPAQPVHRQNPSGHPAYSPGWG